MAWKPAPLAILGLMIGVLIVISMVQTASAETWFNDTYAKKRAIFGNTSYTGTYTNGILINDSSFTPDADPQYVWCNLSVNQTNATYGWIYYNSQTDYACVNAAENAFVSTSVDEGNGTTTGTRDPDLVLWLSMGGVNSTDLLDRSGYNNNFIKAGPIFKQPGKIGSATTYNGVSTWASNAGTKAVETGYFTSLFWIYINTSANYIYIFDFAKNATANHRYSALYNKIGVANAEKIRIEVGSGAALVDAWTPSAITLNSWQCIGGTYNGTDVIAYLNGKRGTPVTTAFAYGEIGTETNWISSENGGGNIPISGKLDDFRMYNRSLSDFEIQSYCNNTAGTHGVSVLGAETYKLGNEVNIVSPAPFYNTTDTTPSVIFNFSSSTNTTAACSLLFNLSSKGINYTTNNATLTTLTASPALSDGDHSITVSCDDGTSTTTSSAVLITIDTTGPVVSIVYPSNSTIVNTTTIFFNVSFSEKINMSWYYLDGGAKTYFTPNASVTASDEATHTLHVCANDTLGNEACGTALYIINVHQPGMTINSPASGSRIFGASYSINLSIVDASTSVLSCNYSIDGASAVSFNASNSTGYYTSKSFDPSEVGNHSITFWCSDGISARSVSSNFTLVFANWTVSIIDEMTGALFNITNTTSAKMYIFCSNSTVEYTFTGAFMSNVQPNCSFTQIRLSITMNSTPYYRTLIPSPGDGNLTFYMVDTYNYNSQQIIIRLNDISGTYTGHNFRIKKVVPGLGKVTIMEGIFDAEDLGYPWLILKELYDLEFYTSTSIRTTNAITPDTDNTVIDVYVSSINLSGTNPSTNLNEFVSWRYSSNSTGGMIRLEYNDTLGETEIIYFFIYNGSNPSQLIWSDAIAGYSDVTFTKNGLGLNDTYIVDWSATHTRYGTLHERTIIGWSALRINLNIPTSWYIYIVAFVLIFTMLLFGPKHSDIGVFIVLFEAAIFWWFGWFEASGTTYLTGGALGLALLMAILGKLAKKGGELPD